MIGRLLIVCLLAIVLAGCAATGPGSIAGGECKIFERPEYAVRGKRPYDQDWIDSQIEGGVGGCGWKRPAARPAALDAPVTRKSAPVAPPKKHSVVQRIRERIGGYPMSPTVPYVAAPILPAVVEPKPAPVPREPVDELLRPGSDSSRQPR